MISNLPALSLFFSSSFPPQLTDGFSKNTEHKFHLTGLKEASGHSWYRKKTWFRKSLRYCFQLSDIQDFTQLTQYATFETVCGKILPILWEYKWKTDLSSMRGIWKKNQKTRKPYIEMPFKSNLPPEKSI